MTKRIPLSLLAVAGVTAVLAGCGGSSNTSASTAAASGSGAKPKGEVVTLSADPAGQLRFTMSKLSVPKPGTVTLVMHNPSSAGVAHGISVEGNGVDKDGPVVAAGKTSMLTVSLKRGTYTFYCPVPGHEQAGMMGTLTVK